MREFDYLIIGQGVAGTCLALHLERLGKRFLILDQGHAHASSMVAAGYMHPITGRRIVKSWMADTLFPFAAEFYRREESVHGKKWYHPMDSIEVIVDDKTVNDWLSRTEEPDVRKYLSAQTVSGYEHVLRHYRRLFRVTGGGWVDLPGFLTYHRSRWSDSGQLSEGVIDYSTESPLESWLDAHSYQPRNIVFCEGQQARLNPFWNWLPFEPAKGEILTARIPDFPESDILTQGLFFIPIGDHCFRVGSTYSWNPLDSIPTDKARQELMDKIERIISCPFEVISHQAGVRPVAKDRRPLVGRHPQREPWFILNGLGSKGSTLAPYLALALLEYIENDKGLPAEADIQQYYP